MNREDKNQGPAHGDFDEPAEPVEPETAPRKKKTLKQGFSALLGIGAFLVLLGGVGFGGYVLFQLYSGFLGSGVEFEPRAKVPIIEAESTRTRPMVGDYTVLDMYFPDSGRLLHEERSVPRVVSVREIATSVVTEFLNGPRGKLIDSIPKDVRLNGIYYGNDKVLYLDLSDSFRNNFEGGVMDEYLLLQALNKSLMANVYQVIGIKVLIEGAEVDTIGGHLSVRGMLGEAFGG